MVQAMADLTRAQLEAYLAAASEGPWWFDTDTLGCKTIWAKRRDRECAPECSDQIITFDPGQGDGYTHGLSDEDEDAANVRLAAASWQMAKQLLAAQEHVEMAERLRTLLRAALEGKLIPADDKYAAMYEQRGFTLLTADDLAMLAVEPEEEIDE